MSFAPPTPSSPSPLDDRQAPASPFTPAAGWRSTPIPGLDATPPTSAQFLGNVGSAGQPGQPGQQAPYQPYQPAPGAFLGASGMPSSPKRRGGGGLVVALLIIGPVLGISVGVWAFLQSREANDQAEQILDDAQDTVDSILADITVPAVPVVPAVPTVPGVDDSVPGVSLPVDTAVPAAPEVPTTRPTLFDPAGATALIGTYEAAIGGAPTKLMSMTIYPDYAIATAQDPANALHVDEYTYRDGFVGEPSPVTLIGDGDLEANLFATTDVDWTFINRAVTEAPSLMPTVEEGVVTHIMVERSVFTPDFSVTVRVYVNGPRGGGYVEYTPAGELIQVMV